MKNYFAKFIILSVFILNSCYTVVDNNILRNDGSKDTEINDDSAGQIFDNSIIEGILEYVRFPSNTPETHYMSGFVLKDYRWFIELPKNVYGRIYVKGNIDSTYLNKRIQIKGYYEVPPKVPSSAPDYTSIIYVVSEKVYVVE